MYCAEVLLLYLPFTMPYITHGFLRADSRNSMGFILLYGKKNVSRYGFRHSVLEATRRPVCHVILQRCAGRDMLDDAAAEAQLAEADELLTAVGFVQYLPRRWAKPGCEDKFWQGTAAGMDVLAFGLCACTKLDGMETTNTGDLSVYLAHSADYEQITVSTVPAKKRITAAKHSFSQSMGRAVRRGTGPWLRGLRQQRPQGDGLRSPDALRYGSAALTRYHHEAGAGAGRTV